MAKQAVEEVDQDHIFDSILDRVRAKLSAYKELIQEETRKNVVSLGQPISGLTRRSIRR